MLDIKITIHAADDIHVTAAQGGKIAHVHAVARWLDRPRTGLPRWKVDIGNQTMDSSLALSSADAEQISAFVDAAMGNTK